MGLVERTTYAFTEHTTNNVGNREDGPDDVLPVHRKSCHAVLVETVKCWAVRLQGNSIAGETAGLGQGIRRSDQMQPSFAPANS